MTYEDQIVAEQSIIKALRNQLKNIRPPPRTISWQHKNISAARNAIQQRLEYKKQKLKLGTKIVSSKAKIISLKEMIFG